MSSLGASQSPLFRLPRELRDIIWGYCLGHNYIHISYSSSRGKFTHSLCRSRISDYGAYDVQHQSWNTPVEGTTKLGPISFTRTKLPPGQYANVAREGQEPLSWRGGRLQYTSRHEICLSEDEGQPQLSLSLMRTSRVVYNETFSTLWGYNTFAFLQEPNEMQCSLDRFLGCCTKNQSNTLRHIAIYQRAIGPKSLFTEPNRFLNKDHPFYFCRLPKVTNELPSLSSFYMTGTALINPKQLSRFSSSGELKASSMDPVSFLRKQPHLRTVLAHVEDSVLLGQDSEWFITNLYGSAGDSLAKDLGNILDLMIMAGNLQPAPTQWDIRKEFNVKLQVDKDVLEWRKESFEWLMAAAAKIDMTQV